MRVARLVLLFSIFAAIPTALLAQQTAQTIQRDPRALSVLQQSLAAMSVGGQLVTSVLLSGQVIQQRATDETQGQITLKFAGPDRFRQEVQLGTDSTTEIVNGSRAVELRDGQSKKWPYHSVLSQPLRYIPATSELATALSPLSRVLYLGQETLEGRPVHHVRVEKQFPGRPADKAAILNNLTAVEFWLDATTLLPLKRAQTVPSRETVTITFPVEFYYSDYRTVNGVLLPFHVLMFVRGQKFREIQFTSASVNDPPTMSDFEVP